MGPPPVPQRDTSEVKDVTEGVREVDLDGRDPTEEPDPVDREQVDSSLFPESIPLPAEQPEELDQPGSDATYTPLPVTTPLSSVNGISVEADADADAEDSDDVASSSEENTLVSEEEKLQKKTDAKVLDPAQSTIEQLSHKGTTS
jgi:hypothetical protein